MDDNTAKYGHVWGYMEGLRPTIVVSDVEMMKEIYIKEFRKFYSRKVSRLLMSHMICRFFSKLAILIEKELEKDRKIRNTFNLTCGVVFPQF